VNLGRIEFVANTKPLAELLVSLIDDVLAQRDSSDYHLAYDLAHTGYQWSKCQPGYEPVAHKKKSQS